MRSNVVLLNLRPDNESGDGFTNVLGDARRLPFKDHSFDLVFSNSLIEHLYTFDQQQQFADECRRVAAVLHPVTQPALLRRAHLLTLFIHWLPTALQARLLRNFTIWGIVAGQPGRVPALHGGSPHADQRTFVAYSQRLRSGTSEWLECREVAQ